MEIRIYDFDGNLLGYTDKVMSAYRAPRWRGAGSCEYHISSSDAVVLHLLNNRHLLLEANGKEMFVITGFKNDNDAAIYGRTLEWLLTKVILPPLSLSGKTVSEILFEIASCAVGIPLEISADSDTLDDACELFTEKYTLFSDVLETLLSPTRAGYFCTLDTSAQRLVLTVKKAVTKTRKISVSEGNADKMTLSKDVLDEANGGVYTKKSTETGDISQSANESFEIIESTASPLLRRYAILSSNSADAAAAELRKKKAVASVAAELARASFGTDYSLGDIFKVQYEAGDYVAAFTEQVESVVLNDDENEHTEVPKFSEVSEQI